MNRASILRHAFILSALLASLASAGCSSDPAPADAALDNPAPDATDVTDVADAADAAEAEAAVPACEMNLPRCNFPDGGAPANVIMLGRIQALSLCNFCHQDATPGAGDFTGQLTPRPMTTAYGTNLSPDPETGIGMLTDEQIARAARCATGRGGRRLCVMAPFAETRLNNDNLCALIAYLRSLPPVRRPIPASTCTF